MRRTPHLLCEAFRSSMPVVCAEARPYLERLPGCDEPTVSPEEAEFFRRNGFLVKRGMASRATWTRIAFSAGFISVSAAEYLTGPSTHKCLKMHSTCNHFSTDTM